MAHYRASAPHHDVVIVGGGLSGLALAEALHRQEVRVALIEGRDRLGGRIKTHPLAGVPVDLGPAWFWPGQPRMDALLQRLSIDRFAQHSAGAVLFETAQGEVQKTSSGPIMPHSWRPQGGFGGLISKLHGQLPSDAVHLGSPVVQIARDTTQLVATCADGTTVSARQIVLALPPRLAQATLTFDPPLPKVTRDAMDGIQTWMAGQAKAIAVFDRPFWRAHGLSGAAISRHGPMVEIHDASPADAGPGALFGFIGVPAEHRAGNADLLRNAVLAQLERLFGPDGASVKALHIEDWALDRATSTSADAAPLTGHPTYGLPKALGGVWSDQLIWAGTEVAPTFGGYLEGALEAAEQAGTKIVQYMAARG